MNLPGGPGLVRLLEVAREARYQAGRGDGNVPERSESPFLVTVSSELRPQALERLDGLGVDRAVVFVGTPTAERVRRLGALGG